MALLGALVVPSSRVDTLLLPLRSPHHLSHIFVGYAALAKADKIHKLRHRVDKPG